MLHGIYTLVLVGIPGIQMIVNLYRIYLKRNSPNYGSNFEKMRIRTKTLFVSACRELRKINFSSCLFIICISWIFMPEICDTDFLTVLSDPKRDFSYIGMPYGQLFSYILKMFPFWKYINVANKFFVCGSAFFRSWIRALALSPYFLKCRLVFYRILGSGRIRIRFPLDTVRYFLYKRKILKKFCW